MFIRNLSTRIKILVIVVSLITILLSAKSFYNIVNSYAPDFSVLWTSTHDLINHSNPYTNPTLFTIDAYPPSTFIFYIPFAIFSYKIAQFLFVSLNFIIIPLITFISIKILFKKNNLYTFLFLNSLILLSFPTKFTLGMGQINLIAFLSLITSYYFYKKNKSEISGILLGLACLIKPVFVLIVLFFILKKKWKIVLYSFIIPTLTTLVVISFFGVDPFVYWFTQIIPQLMGIAGREVYYNQGIIGFISRITTNLNMRVYLNYLISIVLLLLTSAQILKRRDEDLQLGLIITTLLLIDTLSWQHHFVWLILPFILLFKYSLKLKNIWFWGILSTAYLLVSWNFKNPTTFETFPKSLLLSNTFYGAVLIYLLIFYCIKKAKLL